MHPREGKNKWFFNAPLRIAVPGTQDGHGVLNCNFPDPATVQGPALMEHLESLDIRQDLQSRPFRMPVQWVNRPNQDFRGFAGMLASGVVQKLRRLGSRTVDRQPARRGAQRDDRRDERAG